MTDDEDDGPPVPAAKTAARLPPNRRAVVAKLWRSAKRQLESHEARLAALPSGQSASESDAKALATLARTVRELVALDAATASQGGKPADDPDPAAGLRRAEELRHELAQRLGRIAAGIMAGGAAAAAGDGVSGRG